MYPEMLTEFKYKFSPLLFSPFEDPSHIHFIAATVILDFFPLVFRIKKIKRSLGLVI